MVLDFIKVLGQSLNSLDKALECKDYLELKKISHGLKGASGNLRMKDLTKTCFCLEKNAIVRDLELCKENILIIKNMHLNLHNESKKVT